MTNAELSGRLMALEVFVMTTLGLYLANSKNDPDYSKAEALLRVVESTVAGEAEKAKLPPAAQAAARRYAANLAQQVRQNLRALRGEGGITH